MGTKPPPLAPLRPPQELLLGLGSAGHEVRPDESYGFDCRQRQDAQHLCLQLTLAGCGFYTARRSRRRLLPAGAAFLDWIPGPFCYGYAPESTEPYEFFYVTITGPWARRWLRFVQRHYGPVLNLGSENAVAPLLDNLVRDHLRGQLPRDPFLLSSRLYAFLMTVTEVLSRARLETAPRVEEALDLIHQQAHDPAFHIGRLARQLGWSREHLTRRFQAATGTSPGGYLARYRLDLAARHLRQDAGKLERVARISGFRGANYLCRAFRQRFGITPARFRATPGMVVT